jgi:hypothetical protein
VDAKRFLEFIKLSESSSAREEIGAEQHHLDQFLKSQHSSDSVVLYGNADTSGASLYVTSLLIRASEAHLKRRGRFTSWSGGPFDSPSCGLVYGGEEGARVEYNEPHAYSRDPHFRNGKRLVFGRAFEGSRDAKSYFELHQDLTHAHALHWVDERAAWCRLDDSGDVIDLAKVDAIALPGGDDAAKTVSLNRDLLNLHMAATNTCLVQMFDSVVTPAEFHGFDGGKEKEFCDPTRHLVMKYRLDTHDASFFRGAQIIFPPLDSKELGAKIYLAGKAPKQFASFITQDFKNKRVIEVSCDPEKLASYFQQDSSLPFQTSPVFFRPDVLDKYKADPDKYTLESRSITCRNSWSLKTYDVNEAGQVHTLIRYLGYLPYAEQLYWKSFNEAPKASISKRSYTTDFEGSFDTTPDGLRSLKSTLDDLGRRQPAWFTLHEKALVGQLHYPLTTSNKTWNDALIGIAKCVVEGLKKSYFETAAKKLGSIGDPAWGSLKWVREYLIGMQVDADRIDELVFSLVETQRLRSKLSAHAAGNEAATIRRELLKEYGSPKGHIEDLATKLRASLVALDTIFSR